ncbi:hypothetical protein L1987_71639 [Smallanthus sonchifolius]|uniref:Uncharacterized protein n=1 Tax=Smallanthus sonchifolius TaxID=185202 RepID=A0ACB9ATB2_9ASTR|nr:hypothetical protein L1987_71639 [Smallanthus sonchifolius]
MSCRQYSRLCCLIHDSLHPFTVLNKIKLWTVELDSNSGSGSDSENRNPLIDIPKCHSSASHCTLNITNDLVFLLAIESHYVQHLAANVLVSVSEFVVASGSYWEEFMQSLCFYFELIICKVISPSSDPPISTKHMGCDSTDFTLDLQPVLNNARWDSVGAIVSVLRSILKQVKHEDDAKILEIYFQVLGSCLEVIPWDSFADANKPSVSWFEFCGYLVQLFCSLADCEDENPAVRVIFNVFPKILTWYFGIQGEGRNSCISRYIRHKILVLMIRLSCLINLDCVTVGSWLHFIAKYFQDLLSESVSEPEADQNDCLKDSPFNGTSQRHLQRRVIFIYLKCAFSLIGLKVKCKKQCSCGNMNSCSKKGFTAIFEWLKKHLPANILDNNELYDDCCKSFTKSFIQLYMHEDDMLFKILLQLTHTPFGYAQQCLRIICDKWDSFVEFPFWAEFERQSCHKRRKYEDGKTCEPAVYKARDCLLLLKKSVESLHQKDLFPYNPQVLLRRYFNKISGTLRKWQREQRRQRWCGGADGDVAAMTSMEVEVAAMAMGVVVAGGDDNGGGGCLAPVTLACGDDNGGGAGGSGNWQWWRDRLRKIFGML